MFKKKNSVYLSQFNLLFKEKKKNTIHLVAYTTFISHTSEHWKVHDHDAGRSSVEMIELLLPGYQVVFFCILTW